MLSETKSVYKKVFLPQIYYNFYMNYNDYCEIDLSHGQTLLPVNAI